MRLLRVMIVLSVLLGAVFGSEGEVLVRLRKCAYELRRADEAGRTLVSVWGLRMESGRCWLTEGPLGGRIATVVVKETTRDPVVVKGTVRLVEGEAFLCRYESYNSARVEYLLTKLLALYTSSGTKTEKELQLYDIIGKARKLTRHLDFKIMVFDLVIDLLEHLQIKVLAIREPILTLSILIAKSILTNLNYFKMRYISDTKNIMMGAWSNERTTLTFEIVQKRIFLNFIENQIGTEYSYVFFNMSVRYQYLTINSNGPINNVNYIVLIWKEFSNLRVTCTVWYSNINQIKLCDTSSLLPDWEICNCDIIGVVIIETKKTSAMFKNDIVRLGGLTPSFIDLMNVQNLESKYRYSRMAELLILAAIVICCVNIIGISVLIAYYERRWRCFSPTKRQILCLFTMLWLNILLVQPLLISAFFKMKSRIQSSEYIAWGILALYSISSYTVMLGGAQVVLFVATVNSRLWSCRFCDLIIGFMAIISCAIPLLIFSYSYHSVIASINRLLLLPEDYAVKYFVLVPLLFITLLCFILSGMGCYLPKRGGGISMMMVIYPLLVLHGLSYIMLFLMEESGLGYNYLQYLIYASGIFLQAIYLLIWLFVLAILPVKNLTIFGKRDCNFRLEYIYLIDLHCPKVEENICPEKC